MGKTVKLSDAEVKRSAPTANYLNHETSQVTARQSKGTVVVRFDIASKGGGTTELYLNLGPKAFPALVDLMVECDRAAVMEILVDALSREVHSQKENDAQIRREAGAAIIEAAQEKYDAAPADSNAMELLILQRVTKLVEEVEDEGEESVAA